MSGCHADCRYNFGHNWEDVSFITHTLAVGGCVHEEDIESLRELGITHVINVNWPDRPEPQLVREAFQHLDLATLDDGLPKPPEWFAQAIAFASTVGPTDGLLVHCGHGVNRSPAMAYAILRAQGISPTAAEGLVRARRPQTGSGKTGGAFAVYVASAEAALA